MSIVSPTTSTSFLPPPLRHHLRHPKPKSTATSSSLSVSNPFLLEIAEKLEDSLSLSHSHSHSQLPLQKLRDSSSQSLVSRTWPRRKLRLEHFLYNDFSFLENSQITPAPTPKITLPTTPSPSLTILNGHVISPPSALPSGVFAGSLRDLISPNNKILSLLNDRFVDGDLFFDLNGVGAADVAVVYVPEGVRVEGELYLKFCYDGEEGGEGKMRVSNPKVLILVEKGAELAVVEEHFDVEGSEGKCYWANAVVEVVVEEGASVVHSYVQRQGGNSAHTKWTLTQQGASSKYELIEVSTGGKLSRHNLHVQQLGPDTVTELSAFHVAHSDQIQDLHSKLVMDHPRGYSRQLHKCIVSHSTGTAVFDGNIKVNRLAQQTDAGQLTRSLLLAPRASVNVKPNLQIVADDVKCSHGAAISDLEEDQLFYFRARGIDSQTARDALVLSFGAEVLERIPFESFRKSLNSQVKQVLASR